jgi:hypothetical protein
MSKKEGSNKMSESRVNKDRFVKMLKQCYTGGMVPECVMEIGKGEVSIHAIDMSNTVVVSVNAKLRLRFSRESIGIGNIDVLINFLNSVKESRVNLSIEDTILKIASINGRRSVKYNLTEPSLIATVLEDAEESIQRIREEVTTTFAIKPDEVKDILSYIRIVPNKNVKISAEDDALTFCCGYGGDHEMSVKVVDGIDHGSDVEMVVDGETLSKILSNLDFSSEDESPTICMGEEVPLCIIDQDTFWALTPNAEGEDD